MQYFVRSASGLGRPSATDGALRPGLSASGLASQLHSQGIQISEQFDAELAGLRAESDPTLLGEALLALASRASRQDQVPLASAIYSFLLNVDGEAGSSPWRDRAQSRLAVLAGGGDFGDRAEVFVSHFVRDVSDPGLLLGMAAGGSLFRATRFLAMGRLGAAGAFSPLATRFLANAAGFALEAPAFVLTTRSVHSALGVNGSSQSLGNEMLSAYLFLGAMKVSGGAAARAHRGLVGPSGTLSAAGRLSASLFPQVGMLMGIMMSHGLEQELGLRPRQSFAAMFGESLASLIHLNVSGRIFHQLSGSRFRQWERAVDLQTEALARPRPLLAESLADIGMTPVFASIVQRPGEIVGEAPSEPRQVSDIAPRLPRSEIRSLAELQVPEIVEQFLALWKAEESAVPQVDLGEGFGRRVAEWGYAWQENKTLSYERDFTYLRSLHELIERGGSVEARDLEYLDRLMEKAQDEIVQFETSRRILSRVVDFSRKGELKLSRGESMGIDRVLHDLSHRPQFLQLTILAINELQMGNLLEDYYLQNLNPRGGFHLGQSIKEGVNMASAESPDLVSRVWKELRVESLDDYQLAQGSEGARGLGDILANFLTNAWRYRRGDDVRLRFEATALLDGALRFSVSDDGIGIEPQNIASLGSHGFREARVDLSTSHGFGLASVISNLRRLQWGPLWVKSQVGEGTQFQFEIPANQLIGPPVDEVIGANVNRFGQGPETNLENRLNAGFSVPAASMDLAIRRLLEEVPHSAFVSEGFGGSPLSRPQTLRSGLLRHRRLEILHRLLAGARPLESLSAVENGPGSLIDNSLTLLRLGSSVILQEPDHIYQPAHQRAMRTQLTADQLGRLQYVPADQIDRPTQADIVYWPNPDAHRIYRPSNSPLPDYLTRDVAKGGYLVLQSDHHFGGFAPLKELNLNPSHWERIYDAGLPHLQDASSHVLVTAQGENLHLQIYRRRP